MIVAGGHDGEEKGEEKGGEENGEGIPFSLENRPNRREKGEEFGGGTLYFPSVSYSIKGSPGVLATLQAWLIPSSLHSAFHIPHSASKVIKSECNCLLSTSCDTNKMGARLPK